jgi:hypothetical protein
MEQEQLSININIDIRKIAWSIKVAEKGEENYYFLIPKYDAIKACSI